MLERYGVEMSFVIPDMFYLELHLDDGENGVNIPAFLAKSE